MRAIIAIMLGVLLVQPALAQTDDRVMNDLLVVHRTDALMSELARACAAATSNDAELAEAFAQQRRDTLTWHLIGTSLVMDRGTMPLGAIEAAQAAGREAFTRDWSRQQDRAAYCQSVKTGLKTGVFDYAQWYPDETGRLQKAQAGEMPVLDVEASEEVKHALAVKEIFYLHTELFDRCAEIDPPAAEQHAAWGEWTARNVYAEQLADQVLENWGALAPARFEQAEARAKAEAEALIANGHPRTFCIELKRAALVGERDFDVIAPDAFAKVMADAEMVP